MIDSTHSEALVVTRELPASPDRVFDWLTDPAKLAQWMSPQGDIVAEADARVGGRLMVVMSDGQMRIEHHGEYLAVARPTKLVFTWNSPYTDGDSLVTIVLAPTGDRTTVTLRHERLPQGASKSHAGGWGAILDRLAGVLQSATG